MAERYDLVVIGAGPGGYVAAIRAAQLGMKVACVEKRRDARRHLPEHRLHPEQGPARLERALPPGPRAVRQARDQGRRPGARPAGDARPQGQGRQGADRRRPVPLQEEQDRRRLRHGAGRLAHVASSSSGNDGGETTLEAGHILLATGSEPVNLPFLPFDGKTIVSSTEALSFDKVPEHLVVVGGGYIGLELGSVWKRLGAKVTVIEFLPRIVPLADVEVGNLLHKSLAKQGLEFHLETKVTGAKVEDGRVTVARRDEGRQERCSFECDRVLVAVGRRAYTEGLGLAEVGVTVDPKTGKVADRRPLPDQRPDDLGDRRPDRRPDARPQGRGRGGRLRRAPGGQGRPRRITTRSRA